MSSLCASSASSVLASSFFFFSVSPSESSASLYLVAEKISSNLSLSVLLSLSGQLESYIGI